MKNIKQEPRIRNRKGFTPSRVEGQTMILTVLLLSGAILSATAISALLILFQLRQTSDIKTSMQAIFAADAGIECVLFEQYEEVTGGGTADFTSCEATLDNGARYRVVDDGGTIKSIGQAGRTARAFEIGF